MINLTENTFRSGVSEGLVLVDFWSEYCPACMKVKNSLHILEGKIKAGRLKLCEVKVDDQPLLEDKFDITMLPTLILFKGGNPVAKIEGALTSLEIKNFVLESLSRR